MSNELEVSYKEFLELTYETQSSLKILTETVNLFVTSTERRADLQDRRIECIEQKLQGAKETKTVSSLPSNIKIIIAVVAGIAFLGALGAAIGINLLQYFKEGIPS